MAEPTISNIQLDLNSYKVYDAATAADAWRTTQANVYTVEGVTEADGVTLRRLSIAELVMVVCLARAAEKEAAVIALMREMSDTTSILESLTEIETQLLAGTALDYITGTFPYQGRDYSAEEFLAIVLGGATPPTGSQVWDELYNQISNNHIVNVTGNYELDGNTYTKAYEFLYQSGINTLVDNDAYTFFSVCGFADNLDDGVISDFNLEQLRIYGNIDLPSGSTKEDLLQAIDDKYKIDVLNYVMSKAWQTGTITNPGSYLPSSTDQLITDIESKMDSMNSFSQQKMIELQSETNKRDQAYDMITNILKSLNTVQVGISNNI